MIIDAGHINVDSQLADKEVVNDIKSKDKQSKQDAITLESLMYDKFNLYLSQTKVLVGSNTEECLWQLQGHSPRNGVDARFVEPIDMSFLIELCILPGKTEFTKIKVSGHLPLLSVNLSDSKYKILMKIVDFIVPNTDDDDDDKEVPLQPVKRPQMLTSSQRSQSNIITERFWGYTNSDILLPDSASDKSSIRSDTPSTATAGIALSEVEQFKLSFHVDKVSAAICETSSTDPTKESLLCEVLLESFALNVVTRPNDLLVDVSLKALNVVDKIEHVGDFHYLVTSDIIGRHQTVGHASSKNLVNIKYIKASKDHPQFMETYNGYDQTVDVALSTLTVVVTRKSLVRIYNWIMNTFTAPPSSSPANGQEIVDGDVFYDNIPSLDHRPSATSQHKPMVTTPETSNNNSNSNRMKVSIHMDSVDLILNNEGTRMCTGQLSYGQIVVLLEPKTIEVNGKFGNFTLSDDTILENRITNDYAVSSNAVASETYIISIVGEELANFTYKTFDSNAPGFPGYTQKFGLRMGAIQLLVTDSIKPTLMFLQEFLDMKNVSDAARNAAVETAQQAQAENNGFHFDIIIKSPVLIIPAGENKKTDTLVAYLGEIRANNKFIDVHRRDLNDVSKSITVPGSHLSCGLYDISLRSTAETFDKSGNPIKRVLPIIDDLNIVFDIEGPLKPKETLGPSTRIEGNISDVRMSLTERQYKSLLEAWEFIQKNFLATDPKNDLESSDDSQETVRPEETPAVVTSSESQLSMSTHKSLECSSGGQPKIDLDLVIKLNTVYLEVLNGEELDIENRHKQMLARLAFDGIGLKLQNMSNETMLMEVSMQSVSFADTREQSKSKFREILPANTLDGPQFQLRLSTYKREDIPIMDIHITVDSPKIVLSLDYLFLLKDFFASPFVVVEPTAAQKYAQSHSKKQQQDDIKQIQRPNQPPATISKYHINVVDLEVLCLANPEIVSSEAVILSFNQLTVDYELDLQVNLDGIGMILCRMDNREESTMHFMEEFSVLLKMETASTNSVHNLTSIKLNVQPIILRLSYQDAMLITNIVNKGVALMGTGDTTSEPKPPGSDTSSDLDSIGSDAVIINSDEDSGHLNIPGPSGHHSEKPKGIEPFIVMSKETVSPCSSP
jgi:vacuolar protein sorting-associated protein 13A/C